MQKHEHQSSAQRAEEGRADLDEGVRPRVRRLEAHFHRPLRELLDAAELPEASGEAIAREFERYLRRRPDDSTG